MELTSEQQQAARAYGFSFFPATEAQVQRFTMQKRIFRLGGKPFMVTRDGGFWETHGTLLRIIEEHARDEPRRPSEALGDLPKPEQAHMGDTTPSLPVREAATVSSRDADGPEEIARTQVRPPRRRRTGAEVTPSRKGDGAPSGSAETARVEHAQVVVEAPDEVPVEAADQSDSTIRRSRIRQRRATRSAAAGTERGGKDK